MPYQPDSPNLPDNVKKLPDKKKRQWCNVFNSAYSSCIDKGGDKDKCETSAFKQANGVLKAQQMEVVCNTVDVNVRREQYESREYLVFPAVALKPMVLKGELVPAEEIVTFHEAWNGRPVTLYHAKDEEGNDISVNEPGLWQKQRVGWIFNTHLNDDNALVPEVWLDVELAKAAGDAGVQVLSAVESNGQVEVSTAYWRQRESGSGEFGGKQYEGVSRHLRPDHLALLPGGVGECSWTDGCGAPRVNEGGGRMKTQEKSLEERIRQIRDAWHAKYRTRAQSEVDEGWIREVYDDRVIVESGERLLSYSYEVGEDGIAFEDPTEVEVKYVAANAILETLRDVQRGVSNLVNQYQEDDMTKEQKIEALLAQEGNPYDQEELAEAPESLLDKLLALSESDTEEETETEEEEVETQEEGEGEEVETEPAPEIPQAIADALAKLGTRLETIEAGLASQEAGEKAVLVERLVSNDACAFEREELEAMSICALEKLEKSLRPANYSGRGFQTPSGDGNAKVLEMPSLWDEEE